MSGDQGVLARHASLLRWLSLTLIAAALVALSRILPAGAAVARLQGFVEDLGWIGPVVFGAAYVVAAVAFVPGSVLTLAAGAVFGVVVGVATVIVAATVAAAAAFLIARYLLRERVERLAGQNRKFGAIDEAIARGGWRVVGLLRLSPAIPYSLGNYLFGLTRVRFWHYTAATFVGMLPGTTMYVYLGYLGRAGAAAGDTGRTTGEWILLGVGLLATVVVTIYVTRLARRALAERTEAETLTGNDAPARAPLALMLTAALLVALTAIGYVEREAIAGLLATDGR